jgi:hypothetical protein
MSRTLNLSDWHMHDQSVLKEYTDLGGLKINLCRIYNKKYEQEN